MGTTTQQWAGTLLVEDEISHSTADFGEARPCAFPGA